MDANGIKADTGGGAAFTLLEIVVVLAILCLLAGLLFPVFMQARSRARKTTCISNLKQLHSAFANYAQDNDSFLPPYQNGRNAHFGVSNHTYDVPEKGRELVQALHPYTKSDALWFCPDDFWAGTNANDGSHGILLSIDHRYASYRTEVRLGLGSRLEALVGEKVTMEGPTLFLQTQSQRNAANICLLNDIPSPGAITQPYSHSGSHNLLFFDGHVQTKPYSQTDVP